jgi:hypothetical protein
MSTNSKAGSGSSASSPKTRSRPDWGGFFVFFRPKKNSNSGFGPFAFLERKQWTNMRDITPPAIKVTQQQIECVKCGARSHATCSCGMSYRPVTVRVAKYDEANPGKSTRAAAADLGVSRESVRTARKSGDNRLSPDTVTGRDGKEYPATRPPIPTTPVMLGHKLTTKLANELIDAGYKSLTAQFSYDQATLARLKQVRDDLRSHVNNPVEWF